LRVIFYNLEIYKVYSEEADYSDDPDVISLDEKIEEKKKCC
jgi:hypothetical protein